MTPSVHEIAGAFLKMVSYMKWKSIIIVTIGEYKLIVTKHYCNILLTNHVHVVVTKSVH